MRTLSTACMLRVVEPCPEAGCGFRRPRSIRCQDSLAPPTAPPLNAATATPTCRPAAELSPNSRNGPIVHAADSPADATSSGNTPKTNSGAQLCITTTTTPATATSASPTGSVTSAPARPREAVSWRLAAPRVVTPGRGDPVNGELERERRRYHRSHIYGTFVAVLLLSAVLGFWLLVA